MDLEYCFFLFAGLDWLTSISLPSESSSVEVEYVSEYPSSLLIHVLGIFSCVDKLDVLDDDPSDEFVSFRSFYTDLAAIRATNCLYREDWAGGMFLDSGVLGWSLVVVLSAPIWGGSLGICSVCWMLCTALYESTNLQQSSKGSCSLLIFGYNLRADCQWRTLVPPLNSAANAAPTSVLALM